MSVESLFSLVLESNLRVKKVHSRSEIERIWICTPRELRINAISLPISCISFLNVIDSVKHDAFTEASYLSSTIKGIVWNKAGIDQT